MAISAPAYLMLERETVLAMVDKGASVMDIAYHCGRTFAASSR